jgi:hypothetical protein
VSWASADDAFGFEQLASTDVEELWPAVEGYIARATERVPTHLTPELIKDRALEGRCSIWVIFEKGKPFPAVGVMVTSIHAATDGVVLTIEIIAGTRMHDWVRRLLPFFERMAAEHGVDIIEEEGREGWIKYLKPLGYEVKRTIIGKRIR